MSKLLLYGHKCDEFSAQPYYLGSISVKNGGLFYQIDEEELRNSLQRAIADVSATTGFMKPEAKYLESGGTVLHQWRRVSESSSDILSGIRFWLQQSINTKFGKYYIDPYASSIDDVG